MLTWNVGNQLPMVAVSHSRSTANTTQQLLVGMPCTAFMKSVDFSLLLYLMWYWQRPCTLVVMGQIITFDDQGDKLLLPLLFAMLYWSLEVQEPTEHLARGYPISTHRRAACFVWTRLSAAQVNRWSVLWIHMWKICPLYVVLQVMSYSS